MRTEHSTRATRLSLLYFALATAALVWPIYPWLGNRIEPRVLGLPWSLTWVLIVIACNFAVLLVLFRLRAIDDREIDDDADGVAAIRTARANIETPTGGHHAPPPTTCPAAQTKMSTGGKIDPQRGSPRPATHNGPFERAKRAARTKSSAGGQT